MFFILFLKSRQYFLFSPVIWCVFLLFSWNRVCALYEYICHIENNINWSHALQRLSSTCFVSAESYVKPLYVLLASVWCHCLRISITLPTLHRKYDRFLFAASVSFINSKLYVKTMFFFLKWICTYFYVALCAKCNACRNTEGRCHFYATNCIHWPNELCTVPRKWTHFSVLNSKGNPCWIITKLKIKSILIVTNAAEPKTNAG